MTKPEVPESLSGSHGPQAGSPHEPEAGPEAGPEAEPEAEPEPWTPERVTEWNAYYDVYVALGLLLLVFITSANTITHSSIWTALQAGRTMVGRGTPLVTDVFSYTEDGARWVNIPWLFQWGHALLFDGVMSAAPGDPADPLISTARREQIAALALVAVTAMVRLATVLLLLGIRRPGPGLWWSCVCATLALGAFVGPSGVGLGGLGGLAGPALVAPGTWGTLLLAMALYLWHRTIDLGRPGALFGLIPLFLVWANVDDSFLIGLLILTAGVIGRVRSKEPSGANPLPMSRGVAILLACAAVCLVNPSFYRVFPAAATPSMRPFSFSPLVPVIDLQEHRLITRIDTLLCMTIVSLGLASFVLNRRRFSLSRFLIYATAALLWGAYVPYRTSFALVFAATLAMNGQEWYHDRFDTIGRVGRGWSAWSVGGRAVTIVAIFTAVGLALTGWGKSPGDPLFGFGYNPDAFAFEMAEYLRTAPIEGRVLNTTPEQGDALIWRSYPRRQTFIDGRQHLFPPALVGRLQAVRRALSKDDVAAWKPLLDEYGISTVILDERSSPNTYRLLLRSPNWLPFYDDGMVVLFGRADAPPADLAYFRSHRLDARSLAYQRTRTILPPDRPPTPMTWIDRVFRKRALIEPQPHTSAALHWLQGQGTDDRSETGALPDPAHCYLAIQEARIALSHRPDDTNAYRILSEVYRILMQEESALLAGIKLAPENAVAIDQVEPRTGLLMNRYRQQLTSLNAAVQTTPYPRTDPERVALFTLNYKLFQLYSGVNHVDLARDRLQAILDHPPDVLLKKGADQLAAFEKQLAGLNLRVEEIKNQLSDLAVEKGLNPLQRAGVALSEGAPGLAILELEEAERTGISPPALVRPQLVDLYCDTGQPERALELLGDGNVDDPSLGTEPGVSVLRQARVNFLLGYYEYAARLLEDRAIAQLRQDRGGRALAAASAMLKGDVKVATAMFLALPGKVDLQASWEYELALCRLESGKPEQAVGPLTKTLTLVPGNLLRPVVAYYLEKLGKPVPVPPPTPEEGAPEEKPAEGGEKLP